MVCWNLHMPGVKIYTFSSWFVDIYAYHMTRIEIYTPHDYLGEFVVNLNTKYWLSLYNNN